MGKLCNLLAHGTVANCEAARQSLLADEGPDPDSVVVVENGLELTALSSLPSYTPPATPRPLRVGCVANLRPVKALDVLIRAMAQVVTDHPTAICEIVGEGDQREELERLIAELGLVGKVNLRGAERNVAGFLGTLDAAVLCSDAEGLSNAVIEYMAAGRPIVVTDVGGNAELIEQGKQGLVVPRRDEGSLACAIGTLLAEPEFAARLARAARDKALARYERGAMVRRFEDLYTQFVGARTEHD
jgi:glycosyltransferase involved in cell wall biosynthesis